jgi:hypothetical protein
MQGSGDFYLAISGDLQLATSGDFYLATDSVVAVDEGMLSWNRSNA